MQRNTCSLKSYCCFLRLALPLTLPSLRMPPKGTTKWPVRATILPCLAGGGAGPHQSASARFTVDRQAPVERTSDRHRHSLTSFTLGYVGIHGGRETLRHVTSRELSRWTKAINSWHFCDLREGHSALRSTLFADDVRAGAISRGRIRDVMAQNPDFLQVCMIIIHDQEH